jgi:hypothetical protein
VQKRSRIRMMAEVSLILLEDGALNSLYSYVEGRVGVGTKESLIMTKCCYKVEVRKLTWDLSLLSHRSAATCFRPRQYRSC